MTQSSKEFKRTKKNNEGGINSGLYFKSLTRENNNCYAMGEENRRISGRMEDGSMSNRCKVASPKVCVTFRGKDEKFNGFSSGIYSFKNRY